MFVNFADFAAHNPNNSYIFSGHLFKPIIDLSISDTRVDHISGSLLLICQLSISDTRVDHISGSLLLICQSLIQELTISLAYIYIYIHIHISSFLVCYN